MTKNDVKKLIKSWRYWNSKKCKALVEMDKIGDGIIHYLSPSLKEEIGHQHMKIDDAMIHISTKQSFSDFGMKNSPSCGLGWDLVHKIDWIEKIKEVILKRKKKRIWKNR